MTVGTQDKRTQNQSTEQKANRTRVTVGMQDHSLSGHSGIKQQWTDGIRETIDSLHNGLRDLWAHIRGGTVDIQEQGTVGIEEQRNSGNLGLKDTEPKH